MHEPDSKRAIDREMAALFSSTNVPPDTNDQFVTGVMKRIRRRERMRRVVLAGSALIAAAIAIPVLWDFGTVWGGIDLSVLDSLRTWLNQLAAYTDDFFRSTARSVTFLTAAIVAVAVVPLLRWLAD